MFEKIISYSLKNKTMVLFGIVALIFAGIYSLNNIAIDAVPDITNNQVQIVTSSPTLPAEEIERFVTFPVEMGVSNIPFVKEVRSISRYGLSIVTVVFEDDIEIMKARQYISEQLDIVKTDIPKEIGTPQMMPITTGLGEIYQYVLLVDQKYTDQYDLMELRSIQNWIIKRQLLGLDGIIEVSSFGGKIKEYEVSVDLKLLNDFNITFEELEIALIKNNDNTGASYIEKGNQAFYIRSEGKATEFKDIENIIIKNDETPIRVKDVAKVQFGSPKRYGAMTMDGKGEVVGGITLMFKGGNSSKAISNVKERIASINKNLPEGVSIYPYLDRSVLVGKTINTVTNNLIEGGLIVIFVLVIFLGNFRAGLIVSSVIPLSMLFALILMNLFGVSANLMSLGAIDFGIVIDGAVIIVEGILHVLHKNFKGQKLTSLQMNDEIKKASSQIYNTAAFGVLIILVVFVPIFALEGIEGKTFIPMAQTVTFAIIGSLILSVTYVPVISSIFLNKKISDKMNFSDKLVHFIQKLYAPLLRFTINNPIKIIIVTVILFVGSIGVFQNLGAEFIPTLEEGDLAMQMSLEPGSALNESILKSTQIEQILLQNFPEVKHVVSKIGTAEVPTDPMAIEDADIMIILKEKSEWVSASNREDLIAKMKEKLAIVENVSIEFSQPIQLRFNELMTGAKTDIAIQIYGEDTEILKTLAEETANLIQSVEGIGDVKIEQTDGLNQLNIKIDRIQLAIYNLNVSDVNNTIQTAFAGKSVGKIYENEKDFDLVVRLNENYINQISTDLIFVRNEKGLKIPLSNVTKITNEKAPMQISRENANRKISVGINVRDRDVASLVGDIQNILESKLKLPPGYSITYGGQYENLQNAVNRLIVVIPLALFFILFLLFIAFGKIKESLIIFTAVPLASIGGIWALWFRDMPFSISAAIGFIALFGVAVLNGIVLINEFVSMKKLDNQTPMNEIILEGAKNRLRPVLMTALVASLGFLPMALATSNGAEVQKPLASVVIGGLITSTFLTLFVLPALYLLFSKIGKTKKHITKIVSLFVLLFTIPFSTSLAQDKTMSLNEMISVAQKNNIDFLINEKERELWENQKENAFSLGTTDFGIQSGQNDGVMWDNFININQNIGSPWNLKTQKEYAQIGIDYTNTRYKTILEEISFKVKSLYYERVFQNESLKILTQINEKITIVSQNSNDLFKNGAINSTELFVIKNLVLSLHQKIQNTEKNLIYVSSELALIVGQKISIKDTLFTVLEFNPAPLNKHLYQENELKIQQTIKYNDVIKSQYQPNMQVGYFHQSLDKIGGYQGVTLGVAIPLFWSGKNKDLNQNNIAIQTEQIQFETQKLKIASEFSSIEEALQKLSTNIVEHQNNIQQSIEVLKDLENKLNLGEINTIDYLKLSNIIIEGVGNSLSTINSYNQMVIRHEFLSTN